MTLLQRDKENIELGREEGALLAAKIIKHYSKGLSRESNVSKLDVDPDYVDTIIANYKVE